MIKQESVEKVLQTARLEEVIGDFVNLKRAGSDYKGLCPFHQEKTPSFHVSPGKGVYKCFGCGQGGNNAARFLMDLEQMTFPEAIRWLAGRYNIDIEETELNEEARKERQERESLFLLNSYAVEYYQKQLFETNIGKNIGLSYFKHRGYREETIRAFGLGFAPSTRDAFSKDAIAKGYQKEHLETLGLLTDKGNDFFRNRVMFPIHNLSGKVVGLAGRILQKDVKAPKYINSKENPIYNKRKELYGLWQARQSIKKKDVTYLVEGYTDVISLHQAGIQNVVAASGTSLTEDQVSLMKRFSDNITLLFDGDKAGLKAAVRGLGIVLEQDMNVKVVVLPDGEDPDSYLQAQGAAQLEAYLDEKPKDFIHFKMELLSEEVGQDPVKRAALVREVVETIALIPDPIKRSFYLKDCSRLLEIGEEVLSAEINKMISKRLKDYTRTKGKVAPSKEAKAVPVRSEEAPVLPEPKPAPSIAPDEVRERDIARVLVLFGDQILDKESGETVAAYLLKDMQDILGAFEHSLYQQIVQLAMDRLQAESPVNTEYFNQQVGPIQDFVIEVMASPYVYSENWEKKWDIRLQTQKMPEENYRQDAHRAYQEFLFRKVDRMCRENKKVISELDNTSDFEEWILYMEVQNRLVKRRMELAETLGIVIHK